MLTFGILGTIHDMVVGQPIYKFVLGIFSAIFMAIDSMVYAVVNYTYTMFTYIAGARILDSNTLVDMANRVYIVIGVIALFLVAYALLTAIINPDNASKGENSLGKIIPNIAKAIVGIALVPTIFNYAYKIQKEVLCNNIIPRWLLEDKYETINPTKENAGAELSTELFQSFFFINPDRTSNEDKSWWDNLFTPEFDESEYYSAVNNARDGEAFILAFGPLIDNVTSADITYFMLISTIAGLFCAYVLLGYCLDAGLRAIKLAYLQLLAPLPILLTIIPGQNKVFKNWLSKTVSCFLEVFVRIFAMTFVLYIINHLPSLLDSSSEIFESACGTGPGTIMLFLIKAILICALFDFLKQAPKLVSEITGIDSKGFGIGLKGKGILGDALGTLGGAATGAATGALGAGWSSAMNTKGGFKNKVAGFGAGLKYGAANGAKKGGNQLNAMRTQHYTDVLHGKGKAGMFGGQAYIDSKADDARKATQKAYNKAIEDRVTNAPEFISKMNEQMGGRYADFNQKASELKTKFETAKDNFDKNGNGLLNDIYGFESTDTYKNMLRKYENEATTEAKNDKDIRNKIANKVYGDDYLSNPNYYSDLNAKIEEIKRNKVRSEFERQKDNHTAVPAVNDYLNNIKKYNDLATDFNNSKAQYDAVQGAIDATKNSTLEYFANLETSDERLTALKNDADFTIKRRNEKIADDYVKSVDGQKEVAARVEAEKTIGKPNSGQGTAKAPSAGKSDGSK